MSLPFRRKGVPEVGELVVAQVKKVFDYGAYADLLEYENLEAFIPWSEISTKYVKDIREILKEKQVVVGKVIRVEKKPTKIEVDISLKRVMEGEKKIKMLRWKRLQKAQKIIELVSKNMSKTLDEAYSKVWSKFEKSIDPLSILEEVVMRGPEKLREMGIEEPWAKAVYEEAKKHIAIKTVKIRGIAKIVSYKPDGIDRIKKILTEVKNAFAGSSIKIDIYTIGAPKYRIEIESHEYRSAEDAFTKISELIEKLSKDLEIDSYSFEREELQKG